MAHADSSSPAENSAGLVSAFGEGWNRFWFTPSDPRVLCVLRILVGALATYTIAVYGLDLERFFGPLGMVPVEVVRTLQEPAGTTWYNLSILDLASTSGQLWAIHCASLVILAAFTLGIYARLTSVLSLLVVLSYVERGPMLTAQFEPILTFMLFYLCLGPSGAELSADRLIRRLLNKLGGQPRAVPLSTGATIAVRLMQVHLAVVYLMMALGKLQGTIWWDGTAMWWLAIDQRSALVDLSRLHPFAINFWTHALVVYELTFPVLVWNRLARPLVLGFGMLLWLMTALVTGLVALALIMVIGGIAFLPAETLGGGRARRGVSGA